MELSLIKSLMDKSFYDAHRGERCPEDLFSKDARKIKRTLDTMMSDYKRSITPVEVEAYFFSHNPTLTTAQKQIYADMFHEIRQSDAIGHDVADNILSKLFQHHVGEKIANLGFDYVNGELTSLEPLRELLDTYNDDFTPNMKVDWDDISLETLVESMKLKTRFSFNLPTLRNIVSGVDSGMLIEVGARPNTGKTSFHASMVAGPGGFLEQGAKCAVLVNEEEYKRVATRYVTCMTGLSEQDIPANQSRILDRYNTLRRNLHFKEATGQNMDWVESLCKNEKPDVVILDMGDKFAKHKSTMRQDEILKANAIHARQIAKIHNCAIFYMSQLSAEAEGKTILNQSMMEGSKTGKAAEADLMILIAENAAIENGRRSDTQRHLNIVKNKLNGWHGVIHVNLNPMNGRYDV